MRVAFRVDSSAQIGSGHLMRCLTLASELRSRGAEVLFLSRQHPGHMIDRIEDGEYQVHRLSIPITKSKLDRNEYSAWLGVTQEEDAAETLASLDGQGYDWLVVDHYGLDITWEKMIRPAVGRIMAIDDLANRDHDCDLLLDQNYFRDLVQRRYKGRVPDSCQCLLGPYNALLQPEYAQLRAILPPCDGQVRRVLVFFGSGDATGQTSKVLKALSQADLQHLVVDVVIGPNHPEPDEIIQQATVRPGTTVYRNLPTLAGLLARADLVIGAGGATTWERMCLGKPSVVTSVADNQKAFTQMLAVDGYQVSLSDELPITPVDWQQAIAQLLKEPAALIRLSRMASQLVDGLGCKRIARILLGHPTLNIYMRRVSHVDEALLLKWANDPEVRMQSFSQEAIGEEAHARWFASKLADPNSLMLIGEDEAGLPLGLVRFDLDKKQEEALVSISIDQTLRGIGLAGKLLQNALDYWRAIRPAIKFVAEVRDENRRSQRLFMRLQFNEAPSRRMGAKVFELKPVSRNDACITMPTCRGSSTASMDPANKSRDVDSEMKCQQAPSIYRELNKEE
ncbi:putative polysaccharide biosynthesis protein [Legionella lansingensis]|uniref:Putative polysaccharide biosynthesis protein n=1 Tax=Legionella lansingensis TaxID=45067 RepID=A0A0W0VWC6_9GAMM|nr:UDP-2,4-diacetamido-2,4,6-trideoxy-beta-L-altropyranose hydrolase [Legionella lansingensis]KTD24312.1 putative polysaccharide biosynthesis protein [Legionella lansingensis]SNV51827.1 putative polysaccharide biosynthesis protein [Legionella lansingensis]